MRPSRGVCLQLSQSDWDFLGDISNRFGVKKTEFLRLFVQSLKVGEAVRKGKTKVEVGGYGFEFTPEALKSFASQIETITEGFAKDIKVTTTKTRQVAQKRRVETFEMA